jgi:hypothetical protein
MQIRWNKPWIYGSEREAMTGGGSGAYRLTEFGVNVPGCRYTVRPCDGGEPGAERVWRSESGWLLTEKHELRNLFILPVDSEYVIVTATQ